jgi:ADP-ribose pyrophosphatase YjhB (NUDIX family)
MRPSLVVLGLIENGGKFLLVKPRIGLMAGHWTLPSGHVEDGETLDSAVVREIKAKTCLDTEIEGLVGVYQRISRTIEAEKHVVRVVFKMKHLGGEVCCYEEHMEAGDWFTPDRIRKIPDSQIVFGVKEALIDYLERGFTPQKVYSSRKMQV